MAIKKTERNKSICDEVLDKQKTYEGKMMYRLSEWSELGALLLGKESTVRGENTKPVQNCAELLKANRALTAMSYRMLTSQRPFFELEANDVMGHQDPRSLVYGEQYVQQQLELSNYNNKLYKALYNTWLYGTGVVHEPYEPLKTTFLGAPRSCTQFNVVPLINCAFSLDAYDISESAWMCLSDITSKQYAEAIKRTDPKGKIYDLSEVQKALDETYNPGGDANMWVKQRLAWSGYFDTTFRNGLEVTTYYGPLDAKYDGENYIVCILNRTHLIRCERFIGLPPVRVATINNLDVEPLGNGIGTLFRPLLKEMDDTRAALLDTVRFAGANMFAKSKSVGQEDSAWTMRPFGIVEMDGQLTPLQPAPATLGVLGGEYNALVQEFRQASGATDTLQAMVQGDSATATEVSLAMNEAVRNISVTSELLAGPFVRDHIKVILQNCFRYQDKPVTLNIGKTPVTVEPTLIKVDYNVRVKTMTDQDFRPSKINHLLQALQIMNSVPPNAINGYKVSVAPTFIELLKTMQVPDWEKSVQPITEADMLRMNVMAQMANPQPQQAAGPQDGASQIPAGEQRIAAGKPGRREQRGINRGNNMQDIGAAQTSIVPGGQQVLQAPGDTAMTSQAIRSSVPSLPQQQIPPRSK